MTLSSVKPYYIVLIILIDFSLHTSIFSQHISINGLRSFNCTFRQSLLSIIHPGTTAIFHFNSNGHYRPGNRSTSLNCSSPLHVICMTEPILSLDDNIVVAERFDGLGDDSLYLMNTTVGLFELSSRKPNKRFCRNGLTSLDHDEMTVNGVIRKKDTHSRVD